jgi:threonine dehydrogenase-like Zn-dependent dehydrogenase
MPREPPVTTAFLPLRSSAIDLPYGRHVKERVAVIGAGAIGGTVAALLDEAGR